MIEAFSSTMLVTFPSGIGKEKGGSANLQEQPAPGHPGAYLRAAVKITERGAASSLCFENSWHSVEDSLSQRFHV